MIWHASWHAVLYEHMAGRSRCFLPGNSHGDVSSHSTEDTHPKTLQCCWGLGAHATSQSAEWEMTAYGAAQQLEKLNDGFQEEEDTWLKSSWKLLGHRNDSGSWHLHLGDFTIKQSHLGRHEPFRWFSPWSPNKCVLTARKNSKVLPPASYGAEGNNMPGLVQM